MTHILNLNISVRGSNFSLEPFIEKYGISPLQFWLEGSINQWDIVNSTSGFVEKVFYGEANTFEDSHLEKIISERESWLLELKNLGVTATLLMEIVVDNDVSYSPSFEFSPATLGMFLETNLLFELTPCCKYTTGG